MMGNRLVDSSTGNRDGITTEFSLVAGVIARLFSMLRNYRWKGWNGWMEVGSWIPSSERKFVSGNVFVIYENLLSIYLWYILGSCYVILIKSSIHRSFPIFFDFSSVDFFLIEQMLFLDCISKVC